MIDLPVPGPPWTRTTDFFASWKPSRASARTDSNATRCSSRSTKSLLAAIIAAVCSRSLRLGSVARLEDAGHDGLAAARAQLVVEELGERVRLVAGVERVAVERLGVAIGPELASRRRTGGCGGSDGGQRDRIGLVEDLVVVEQPLLVAADLDRWVEDAPDLLADVQLDAVVGG